MSAQHRSALCALLALAGLLTAGCAGASDGDSLSGTAIVTEAEYEDYRTERLLEVRTPGGMRYQVDLHPRQLHGLRTGMQLSIAGSWKAPATSTGQAGPKRFSAATISATGVDIIGPTVTLDSSSGGRGGGVGIASGRPGTPVTLSTNRLIARQISTLVIPIAAMSSPGVACPGTELPFNSANDVRRAVLPEYNPRGTTAGSVFSQCSYGKSVLNAANSMVSEIVQLPCSGTSYGWPWTFSNCDSDDDNGVADAAEERLRLIGVDVDKYNHKVYLLPPGFCPQLVAKGYVGCDGFYSCRNWVGGYFWNSSQAVVHEIGHNLFLDHAGSQVEPGRFDEYADDTCAMGYCCTQRCFNTPHAWQMGWLSVQELNSSALRPGMPIYASIASQALTPRSGVRILPTWAPKAEPIFLGFRSAERGDVDMNPGLAGKVHIYTANITGSQDSKKTSLDASLKAGQAWTSQPAGLVLRYLRTNPAGEAVLWLCRKGGRETLYTCRHNVDNDCNGLVGSKDPACLRLLGQVRSPPPPPIPRPPIKRG